MKKVAAPKRKSSWRGQLAGIALATIFAIAGIALVYQEQYRRTPYVVEISLGGQLDTFIAHYDELRRSGRPVVVDSLCVSACTLVIGLIPRSRVCVTPYARFAFHSATVGGFHSDMWTRFVWQMYPEPVQAILREEGWDGAAENNEHQELIFVAGDRIFNRCRH